jgi:hypothetical protein
MAEIKTKSGHVILVDDEDFERFGQHGWYLDSHGYPTRNVPHPSRPGKRTTEKLHRAIMGLTVGGGGEVDHANRDPLDNRRSNLRLCTKSQNQWNKGAYSNNSSGFKGVTFDRSQGKWEARIRVDGRMRRLGRYNAPEAAHAAYCAAVHELRGQFACTN